MAVADSKPHIKEVFRWQQDEELIYHKKCPLKLVLSCLSDIDEIADIYFGCKLCSETVALYQGEETFIEHIQTCHEQHYNTHLPPPQDFKPLIQVAAAVGEGEDLGVIAVEQTADATAQCEDEDLSSALQSITQASTEHEMTDAAEVQKAEEEENENETAGNQVHFVIEGSEAMDIEAEGSTPTKGQQKSATTMKTKDSPVSSDTGFIVQIKQEEDENMKEEITDQLDDSEITDGERKCWECDEPFLELESLLEHMKEEHSEEKPFVCEVCGKGFAFKHVLEAHQHVHEHVCPTCGEMFETRAEVNAHMRTHTKEEIMEAELSQASSADESTPKRRTLRDIDNPVECPHCLRTYPSRAYLLAHRCKAKKKLEKLQKSGISPQKVSQVPDGENNGREEGEIFIGEDGVVYAIETKAEDALPPEAQLEYDPDYEYQSADDMKEEKPNVVRKGKRGRKPIPPEVRANRFRCQYCGKSCPHKNNLIEHERTHEGIKPHACPDCGKCFTKKANMESHRRIHTGIKSYICEICSKPFLMKSQLTAHIKRIHTDETPFGCEYCGKAFKDRSTLKKHVMIHTGETPHMCDYCGQAFRYRVDLNIHVADHEGRNPLTCQVCGKKFNKRHNFSKHMYVHTGEKRYECALCKARFREKSHLNRHVRLHSGLRPYHCDMGCNKSFPDLGALNRHRKTHTTAYKCSVCDKTFTQKHHAERHLSIHMGR